MMEKAWSKDTDEVIKALQVAPEEGLNEQEVKDRKKKYGPNRLKKYTSKSAWRILWEQFTHIIIALLVVAAVASFIFGHITEGVAIILVILINATIGFLMEFQAVRSMEALRELGSTSVKVKRDGKLKEIPADNLVPGDIVVLESGDMVNADMRIIEASKLQSNESALTGESLPVSKQVEAKEEDTILAERSNMLFKGTSITRGSAEAVVTSTGMDTELGNISQLVEEAEKEETPLEKRLSTLGNKLVWVTVFVAVLIFASGYLSGLDLLLMVETAIALAVATVPEGLPVVATIALARGMWRMADRNALIKSLSAVETLGATNIICTDKTGTLTENELTVKSIYVPGGKFTFDKGKFISENENELDEDLLDRVLIAATLCNNANYEPEGDSSGDPLEVALLSAAHTRDIVKDQLLKEYKRKKEDAFDPTTKKMGVIHHKDDRWTVSVKGAPEVILNDCNRMAGSGDEQRLDEELRKKWEHINEEMAEEGLRVIGLASKTVNEMPDDIYDGLELLGFIGMYDPPRDDVKPSVNACQRAGIEVIMVTGDQSITARKIGLATGIIESEEATVIQGADLQLKKEDNWEGVEGLSDSSLFARVNPEQKLDLISYYKEQGAVVAMTGDGVNDAPALKKADIGIAMGKRGTQVAKEASDVVLLDDAFSSIVTAVREGRVIFGNIRKFVYYLLSCNLSEIFVIGIASVVPFLPLPILPLQILFLNLVSDVFPALALGVGEGDESVMKRPPRKPEEDILTRKHWIGIFVYGLIMTAVILSALYLVLFEYGYSENKAVTISFLILAFSQLWHVFNMSDLRSGILFNEVTRNLWVWGALVLCILLLVGSIYIPVVANVLDLTDPGYEGWRIVFVFSLIPLVAGQLFKVGYKHFTS